MIERRTKAEQSAENFLRAYLLTHGYDLANDVAIVDSFNEQEFQGKLDKSYIASGFNLDDGGKQAELGSDFTRRIYTMEWLVYGQTPVWGKNLAFVIESAFDGEVPIPMIDVAGTGQPTGEFMYVEYANAQRAIVRQPRPFEYNLWMVRARLMDEYYGSQQ